MANVLELRNVRKSFNTELVLADLSIVEDFTDTLIDVDQEIIDQAEDTMTILSRYIDNLTLNVEGEKLKTLMRELYVEALNTEKTE